MIRRLSEFFGQFDRALWVLASGWFVGALGFAASIPFISIYFHNQLGMSTTEIGLFFGGMAVVRSVFQMVGGEMSDRIGRRGLLIHSQTIRAFSFVGLGAAMEFHLGFWAIAFWFLVNSIFGAVFMPAVNALVSDILPPEKRLDGFAISRSAGNLGWAVGPALGGLLVGISYAALFYLSAVITLGSAAVFRFFLKVSPPAKAQDRFRFKDLLAVRQDRNLAIHSLLILALYLVVAQLIAPFSVYSVEMVGIEEKALGLLYGINGFLVVALQIPVTRWLGRQKFTSQLAWGSMLYFIGYGMVGFFSDFGSFAMIMVIVTFGEVVMSPPSLTLTSHLAPEGRTGRYMGVYGFFVTIGWSLGPLYGGLFLDTFADQPILAWLLIASLALVAVVGYLIFGCYLPDKYNYRTEAKGVSA
jgi:MFS family permease